MEIKIDIKKKLGCLSTRKSGWSKEVNIVSWNEGLAKYDIREWSPDHRRMSKGFTAKEREMYVYASSYAKWIALGRPLLERPIKFGKERTQEVARILANIGAVEFPDGATAELNFVSWNGDEPKFDLRYWSPNRSSASCGVRLSEKEAETLFRLYDECEKGVAE